MLELIAIVVGLLALVAIIANATASGVVSVMVGGAMLWLGLWLITSGMV